MSAVTQVERSRKLRWRPPTFWSWVAWGALAMFLLLLVYPLFQLFAVSLAGGGESGNVLKTYTDFFTKSYYYETLFNSMFVSVLATIFAVLLGVPMAYFVSRFNIPGKLVIRAAIVLTFVSPPFIGAYAWILLLGSNGIITRSFADVGVSLPSIYGPGGMVLVFTLQGLPFVFLMASSGLKSVDQSIEDASTNLGRRPLQVMMSVIFPLIVPAISTGALLVFVTSFSDFGTPMILGQNYRLFASVIYTEFVNEHGGNASVASALSLIMLLISVGALFLQRWYSRRHSYGQQTIRPLVSRKLSGMRLVASTSFVYVIVLAASLPMLAIVVTSFLRSRGPSITGEWTFDGYARALRLPMSLTNTVVFSTIATIICVVAGCLIGYVVVRRKDRLASTLDAFSVIPYAVPGVVLGIAVAATFGGFPFNLGGTAAILILVYFVRRVPYSIRSISGMLSQQGEQTEEASINLGVPPGRTFWRITIPMLTPAILSGALLTWATVAREFNSTVILYSGSTRTLPVEVFAQVLQGNFGPASVVGTVLILVSLVPILLLFKFLGKDEEFLI